MNSAIPLPEWRPGFACGHAPIDNDHRQLFSTLAGIVNGLAAQQTDSVPAQFALLMQQTRAHFDNEERLLESIGFPNLQGHRALHASLLAKMDRLLTANLPLGRQGMETLALRYYEGVVLHVIQEDRGYFAHLVANGMTRR